MNYPAPKKRRPWNDFPHVPAAPVAIIATPGGKELAALIDAQLVDQRRKLVDMYPQFRDCPGFLRESYLIDADAPRFRNGEGKAIIHESIRGFDLYFVADVNNWGITYIRNGHEISMSPDEHYQDLKRLISATRGSGYRVNAITPLLYEGRQHKIAGRESLDCAMALQELVRMGVQNIMTIDAHNSHVQNAIPHRGFENLHANYQHIKEILENEEDFRIGKEHLVVVSPDIGGLERCRYFAEHFRCQLSAFYKVRDLSRLEDGKAPVIEHRFFGGDIAKHNALIVDDLIASGESVLEVAKEMKERGADKIYVACTFALFNDGIEAFNKAYNDNIITRVYSSNATHTHPELAQAPWYRVVDVSHIIALYIDSFNRNESVSRLLDNSIRIQALLERKGLL